MTKLKLPIALDTKSNKLIHISKVTPDNKNCFHFVCPECKNELITKIGKINTPHFAHKNTCNINGETIIHLMAKKVLSENNKISLPIYNPICMEWQSIVCDYKYLYSEKSYNDIIPDVVINIDDREVFIEVAYTHFIDKFKEKKLNDLGIETWEINLKGLNLFNYEDFTKNLLFDDMNKKSFVLNLNSYKKGLNENIRNMFGNNKIIKELANHYYEYKKLKQPASIKTKHDLMKNNYYRLIDITNDKSEWVLLSKDSLYKYQVYLLKLIDNKIEYNNIAYYHDIYGNKPFESFMFHLENNINHNIMQALRQTLSKNILNEKCSFVDKKYLYNNYFGNRYFLYDVSGINYKKN